MAALSAAALHLAVASTAGCTVKAVKFEGLRACPQVAAIRLQTSVRSSRRSLSIFCAAAPETLSTVQGVIATQLAVDAATIKPDSKFVDLGADSLDTVEIMMALEEKFDITLDEDNAEKIETVQQAADLIQEQVSKA
eukprot:jgi/Mesen1/5628/ME000282S04768